MKKLVLLVLMTLLLVACTATKVNIMDGYKGFNKKDHHFITKDYNDIIDDITSYKQGIYYLGFKECPWCIALVPVFEEVATTQDMSITYLNTREDKYVNDTQAIQKLNDFITALPVDQQNDGKVPFIISISKDKVVKTHLGTAPNHDARSTEMTESEVSFLTSRLNELFKNAK